MSSCTNPLLAVRLYKPSIGKSVIKKFRKLYPDSNIVAIDYDPGASHTNQANRIKLMLTVARENLNHK